MNHLYEVKTREGQTIFSTTSSDNAIGYYYAVKNKFDGYAEIWHGDKCIYRTFEPKKGGN